IRDLIVTGVQTCALPICEHPVNRRLMAGSGVIDAPQHVELMGSLGQQRQVFADQKSRHAGRDRSKLAANFGWSLRFQIPRIEMRSEERRVGKEGSDGGLT